MKSLHHSWRAHFLTCSLAMSFVFYTGCDNPQKKYSPIDHTTNNDSTIGDTKSTESSKLMKIQSKILELDNLIKTDKLTFTVGITSVAGMEINQITGERNLSKTEADSFSAALKKSSLAKANLERADPFLTINGKLLSPKDSKLDLRDYGLVTPVKDQGRANTCWSFGSMAAYESAYKISNNQYIDASEQYVIDCSGAGTALNGGLAFKVLLWMADNNKNTDNETHCPYHAIDESCQSTPPPTNYYAISWNLVDPSLNPNNIPTVQQIKEAICRYGVISASVYVSDPFQYYTGGVFKENQIYQGTNHAVALIGWDDSKNSWILKNSWGPSSWGETCGKGTEKGFMWIDYGTNNIGKRAAWIKAKKTNTK